MSLLDGMRTAEVGMNIARMRAEVAGRNSTGAYTPGYVREEVIVTPGSFASELANRRGRAGAAALGGGAHNAVDGAARVVSVGSDGQLTEAAAALQATGDMMEARQAYELSMRSATLFKSMALASLEIGRGS